MPTRRAQQLPRRASRSQLQFIQPPLSLPQPIERLAKHTALREGFPAQAGRARPRPQTGLQPGLIMFECRVHFVRRRCYALRSFRGRECPHVGDQITRDIITLLNTQYLTPFDREDIYELTTSIDDVVDHVEEASARLELYDIETMSRHAIELARILAAAVSHLATALGELKTGTGIGTELVKVKQLEDDGDRVVRDAIASLFHAPGIDPLLVIKWKDIYERLEDALDGCEKVANVIANIVVKNV